jgi:hypothetical protein
MRALWIMLVAGMLLAGCGGSAEEKPAAKTAAPTPKPAATALLGALAAVGAGEDARDGFQFSDIKRLRALGGYPERAADVRLSDEKLRWAQALAMGAEPIGGDTVRWSELQKHLAIDYMQADRAIGIGEPPHRGLRLDGLPAGPVLDAAHRAGAKDVESQGRTILARQPEGKIDFVKDPLGQLGLTPVTNRVAADGETVVLGGYDATVAELLGGSGDSLADLSNYQAAASCLGDVVAVQMYPGRVARIGGALIAFGIREAGGGAREEVLCNVGVSPQEADKQLAALRKRLAPDAISPQTRAPVGEVIESSSERRGSAAGLTFVQLTVRPSEETSGFIGRALADHSLDYLFGGCVLTPKPHC